MPRSVHLDINTGSKYFSSALLCLPGAGYVACACDGNVFHNVSQTYVSVSCAAPASVRINSLRSSVNVCSGPRVYDVLRTGRSVAQLR